jgi:IS5 family transposase
MIQEERNQGRQLKTLGADKVYDSAQLVEQLRSEGVTPHIAQNISGRRSSNVDGRTRRTELWAYLVEAAYNMVRMTKLMEMTP